jgi:transposase
MKKLQRMAVRFKGWTLGLDLHQKQTQYSLLDEAGDEVENQKILSSPSELTKLIDRLTVGGTGGTGGRGLQVVLEASGCFTWAFDLLVGRLERCAVHVAAPGKVRVIAESQEKNDATDAWWLAYLLYEGRLPEAFVAEGALRELRIASREFRSVTQECSDLMRRMRSHLAQLGEHFAKSAWDSVKGQTRIGELVSWAQEHHGQRGQAIARLWGRIQGLEQELDYWSQQVNRLASGFSEVALLDRELPGVGPVVAAIVWSELGSPQRYRSAKAYAKATGLTPGYRDSAGRRSRGKITRQGSAHVRWALTRAVVSCLRCRQPGPGVAVKQWVERMIRRKSKKASIVAAARKLAEGVWRLFALGEAFDLGRAFGAGPRRPMPRVVPS